MNSTSTRRRWLVGGVAGAAAAAGIGAAWWRHESASGAGGERLQPEFWTARYERPEGGELDFSAFKGKPLLLNFWATWCPPCVTEMPLLDAFATARSDWNVLALAVDAPDPVRRFMSERRLKLPVAIAPDTGLELGHRLGNAAGGLPFSIAFAASGKAVQRKLGAVDDRLLQEWAKTIL